MKYLLFYCILLTPILSAREAAPQVSEPKQIQLIYFTASWCGPCQLMKQETWPNPLVQKALENYVFVTVDVDAQPKLSRELSIRSMPTYLLFDASGQRELARMSGYMDAHRMATWLNTAHTRAQQTLESILEAEAIFQARWKQLEAFSIETATDEALYSARSALYALLERRGDFDEVSARELDMNLAKIAQSHPERLVEGILHPDLQVRAYIARALKSGGHFFNPWDRLETRRNEIERFLTTPPTQTKSNIDTP